jgi:adenylate cyclase
MSHFAGVLEKLGEAIDMDPMHIIKALQMYAEAASLTSSFT